MGSLLRNVWNTPLAHTEVPKSEEFLKSYNKAVTELGFCRNRIWAVAGEDLSNLLPSGLKPTGETKHEFCGLELCEYSERDFTSVTQRHECEKANCHQLRLPWAVLEMAALDERSTVWSLSADTMLEYPRPYMAVSHVWSDGTGAGAWENGQLNSCLFEYFRRIAEQFQCQGIWWDVICLPRGKAARSKTIRKIQSSYQNARITLVHDCFLRDWEWDPESACFAILMSPWFSRGWTALELAKSRKVKVIFKGPSGELIKDLDEEILAKECDPDSPRKRASQIIRNLRKNLTTLNDLLTVLKGRFTSWKKDMSVISALLVGVTPKERQQDSYRSILRHFGRLAPGHLFHNAANMTQNFRWCPSKLFKMPLDPSIPSLTVTDGGNIRGKWLLIPVEPSIEKNCYWNNTHHVAKERLRTTLRSLKRSLLLAECGLELVRRAVLVEGMDHRPIQQIPHCRYVGVVHFRQELKKQRKWIEKEVMIVGEHDDEQTADSESDDAASTILDVKQLRAAKPDDIQKREEVGQVRGNDGSKARLLRDAVWRGDFSAYRKLVGGVNLEIPDQLGQHPIHLAAERGNEQIVKDLIHRKANLYARCNDGQTALHRAAWAGSIAVVGLLLTNGSKVAASDNDGNTALHMAARMGFEQIVETFVGENGDVNAEGFNTLSPLHYAVLNSHTAVAQVLLRNGADVEAKDSKAGWTALHCAAGKGDYTLTKLLLQERADVNATDNCVGWTPLHIAAVNGHEDIAKLLIRGGADTAAEDEYGWTPLLLAKLAIRNGRRETLIQLLTGRGVVQDTSAKTHRSLKDESADIDFANKCRWTPLHCRAIDGGREILDLLVEYNVVAYFGKGRDKSCTLMPFAIENGLANIVEWQLKGGDIHETNSQSREPLVLAAMRGHDGVVRQLLMRSPSSLIPLRKPYDALAFAAKNGHTHVITALLSHGTRVDSHDWSLRTPLMMAAENGHEGAVCTLIENGADIYQKDDFKRRAISWALEGGHQYTIRHLAVGSGVASKMDELYYSTLHWTPLMMAIIGGRQDIIEQLLDEYTIKNMEDAYGHTPLMFAILAGYEEPVEELTTHILSRTPLESSYRSAISKMMEGHEAAVEKLRKNPTGIDIIGKLGYTPLMVAIMVGDDSAAEENIAKEGININATDKLGFTALMLAIDQGRKDIVGQALEKHADANLKSKLGHTALMLAIEREYEGIVKELLKKGADVNQTAWKCLTPLMLASSKGHQDIVRRLLEKGAETNVQDTHGRTPLIWAMKKGDIGTVRLLIEKGADITWLDHYNRSSLLLAEERMFEDVAELLNAQPQPGAASRAWIRLKSGQYMKAHPLTTGTMAFLACAAVLDLAVKRITG